MPEEADVEKGMISTSSPIGRAILNKEEGDEIKVVDAERQQVLRADQAHHHPRRSVTVRVLPGAPDRGGSCGTGAHGAYHAGVLRALQEAGVKIDVFAGHGVGAADAALAAIGGTPGSGTTGRVAGARARGLYGWKRSIRWAGWIVAGLVAALVAPVALVVLSGVVVYPLGFLLETAGSGFGTSLLAGYADWLQTAFAGPRLPTFVPRVGMILVSALAVLLLAAAVARRTGRVAATGTRGGVVAAARRAGRRRRRARRVHGRASGS